MTNRESQILCGLLLSKYNEQGLASLGFESFAEAYNVLGSALDVPASTIKNYRDELDPYFPNERKGWHQRPLRKHCGDMIEKFGKLSLPELSMLVKGLFDPTADLPRFSPDPIEDESLLLGQSAFAKRLVTGRAAEGYFRTNYRSHAELADGALVDTTAFGCGFDFRLNFTDVAHFYAVEVKGIYESGGNIMLTEKEHRRAAQMRDRYYLYVVRNFRETPFASLWRDPLNTDLQWDLQSRQLTVNSWITAL